MTERQTLKDLLEQTDALTYINALQVTLKELKALFSTMEELGNYTIQTIDKSKKLLRRADHQYRVVAKLVQGGDSVLREAVMDNVVNLELQELIDNE